MAGASPQGAVVIGGALALSSTAIVTKQLAEQFEINSRHGRTAVGILLFQDLAVVPLLILIPILAGESDSLGWPLTLAMLKGIAVFAAMVAIGRRVLRPLFHQVAAARSNEVFTLAVLLVALLAAWATHLADLSLALSAGLIGHRASQIVLASILFSMVLAPFLIRHSDRIASRLLRSLHAPYDDHAQRAIGSIAQYISRHVILCGYGRTGQNVARFLENEGIPYLALDLDPERVQEARAAGDPVSFGDASRQEILQAAGVERARMVVITYDDPQAALRVLRHARPVRPDLPILVRTRDDAWLERFEEAGATAVRRGGIRGPQPAPETVLQAGDVLVLYGSPENLEKAEARILSG
jgi:voltage-gated potassium channel Kch